MTDFRAPHILGKHVVQLARHQQASPRPHTEHIVAEFVRYKLIEGELPLSLRLLKFFGFAKNRRNDSDSNLEKPS